MFDNVAGYAVNTAFSFLAVIPILFFWLRSLQQRKKSPIVSAPVRLARRFVRASPPLYALGAILGGTFTAIIAAEGDDTADDAIVYVNLVSGLVLYAADIGITLALYLCTLGSLYAATGRMTWWRLLRLDACVGGLLLLVLDLAFFGRNVALANGATPTRIDRGGILWLPLIIDLTLLAVTVGSAATLVYVRGKLGRKGAGLAGDLGRIPTLLLVASALWIIRCAYAVATTIKTLIPDWTENEYQAQLIVYPMLELWIGASVLALLTMVVRNAVWTDPAARLTASAAMAYDGEEYPRQPPPAQGGYYSDERGHQMDSRGPYGDNK
ncbi:hypothetical protein QBC47DRAFT_85637 [Echria macrotheca]|uniref:Uncharacterized protein n=1 Tax=Echria macrotheca TaxID=438768 RepID=A0AAJ0B877_9PEZI|nr:hypothetical protein QBC47DRAFT_85637 [Echria macrotheca]